MIFNNYKKKFFNDEFRKLNQEFMETPLHYLITKALYPKQPFKFFDNSGPIDMQVNFQLKQCDFSFSG